MSAIGVFDSGLGGLTVFAALERQLPHEALVYLGDTARLPYGTKSATTVIRYTRRNVDFLVGRGVKGVVVACNTASALALPDLREPVPLWGVVEPGARAALAVTSGRVGVIATDSTIRSGAYQRALARLDSSLVVEVAACPLFVPLVEEGWADDPVAHRIAERYLAPLLAAEIDTLLLGCTHYPLLADTLAEVAGPSVRLVDSAEATAREVARDLVEMGLAATAEDTPRHHVCVTDAGDRFAEQAERFLGARPELEWIDLVETPSPA